MQSIGTRSVEIQSIRIQTAAVQSTAIEIIETQRNKSRNNKRSAQPHSLHLQSSSPTMPTFHAPSNRKIHPFPRQTPTLETRSHPRRVSSKFPRAGQCARSRASSGTRLFRGGYAYRTRAGPPAPSRRRSIALATRVTRHRISAGRLETAIAAQGGRPSSTCHNSIESLSSPRTRSLFPFALLNY